MKEYMILIILLFVKIFQVSAQNEYLINNNTQIAPSFNLITLEGDTISSNELKGKIIILDFWSSTCIPCIKSMSKMEKLYKKYKNNKSIAIYVVNNGWETLEKAKEFANKKRSKFLFFSSGKKYDLPFAYDSGCKTFKSFNLKANPSTVIIDQNYHIHLLHTGYIEDINHFLTNHIEQLLARG